jgi:hypothetical protein
MSKLSLTLGIILLSFSTITFSEEIPLTWDMPTQNTDGSAIPATGAGSLSSTTIEHSICNNGQVVDPKDYTIVQVPDVSTVYNTDVGGDHCFQASVVNTFGNNSNYSNVLVKTVEGPPTGDLVTNGTLVFWLLETSEEDRLALEPVGEIPLGTPCDETIRVDAHYWPVGSDDEIITTYRVNKADVSNWFSSSSYSVVMSTCSRN